jgi:hypothetical protein
VKWILFLSLAVIALAFVTVAVFGDSLPPVLKWIAFSVLLIPCVAVGLAFGLIMTGLVARLLGFAP